MTTQPHVLSCLPHYHENAEISMFKPVDCVRTNVQNGCCRFSGSQRPLIKSWRCELTGLSHSCNLYFVACNDEIHVYTPSFPEQKLSRKPDLILYLPVSSPTLSHGIDHIDPHSITRLHVDYLGREEIILVTCDDGDVIGYRVSEIYRAIVESQRAWSDGVAPPPGHQVRVFLHRNVGGSAWGLAVHREARLIAISANTHEVTVLAYALSNASADSDSNTPENSESSGNDEEEGNFPYPRRRDHVITLRAATNIPAVSFDQEDHSGRWLFSSSIDGVNHLWDLYNPQVPATTIMLGHCVSVQDPTQLPGLCRCQNRTSVPHAAWAAMFVDPRSCHHTTTLSEACGPGYGLEDQRPARSKPGFWDITETKLPYSAERNGPFPGSFGQPEGPPISENEVSVVEEGSVDTEDGGNDETNQPPTHTPPQLEQQLLELIPGAAQHPELALWLNNDGDLVLDPEDDGDDDSDDDGVTVDSLLPWTTEEVAMMATPWALNALPYQNQPPQTLTKHPYCVTFSSDSFEVQPRTPKPCIIVTKEEVYLFQRPFDADSAKHDPILAMRNPLFPPPKGPRRGPGAMSAFHRNCYATQIPELGVFIVASPAGRVGIFSLTKYSESNQQPLYAFRMDHLLPSVRRNGELVIEEEWGRRLIGVAVGPVQGMLDRDADADDNDGVSHSGMAGFGHDTRNIGGRRWRLMMHFHDHTVYSYELGKFSASEAPGLGELVV